MLPSNLSGGQVLLPVQTPRAPRVSCQKDSLLGQVIAKPLMSRGIGKPRQAAVMPDCSPLAYICVRRSRLLSQCCLC